MGAVFLGMKPDECIDHINGDPTDNRLENLRIATHRQNLRNQNSTRGASKFKGVSRNRNSRKKPWRSYIVIDGKQKFLGTFLTQKQAARAYDAAAKKFFGEFARLNFLE